MEHIWPTEYFSYLNVTMRLRTFILISVCLVIIFSMTFGTELNSCLQAKRSRIAACNNRHLSKSLTSWSNCSSHSIINCSHICPSAPLTASRLQITIRCQLINITPPPPQLSPSYCSSIPKLALIELLETTIFINICNIV